MATAYVQFSIGAAHYRASRDKDGGVLVQTDRAGAWVTTWSLAPHRVGTALLQERDNTQLLTPDEERQ